MEVLFYPVLVESTPVQVVTTAESQPNPDPSHAETREFLWYWETLMRVA
ncbi:hypothetical protein K4A83_19085 [Spirulina subsalsa FACHB-351]|uniref:Uncharacterized protein n=1 Tax=Spirulina subsalsa FACHB-351 TaxID=234711 RepID=A0ABT3LA27_9CYAN|nr:hypothetical protein [Spirulina subsalsa]MCW6038361.1 hypothetical protein [Spirulina subsalsa FACHB-351]